MKDIRLLGEAERKKRQTIQVTQDRKTLPGTGSKRLKEGDEVNNSLDNKARLYLNEIKNALLSQEIYGNTTDLYSCRFDIKKSIFFRNCIN